MKFSSVEKSYIKWMLFIAFVLRFWAVMIAHPAEYEITSDMAVYYYRGQEILAGKYDVNQLFQPLGFTLWSMWMRALGGWTLLKWSQIFISMVTVVITFLFAKKIFGKTASLIALTLACLHTPWIFLSSFHLSENIFAFTIMLLLVATTFALETWSSLWFFGAGLSFALAFYFKGTLALFIPFFTAWMFWTYRDRWRDVFKKLSFMAVGCMMLVGPHLFWTAQHYGRPYLGPTAGGLNFVEGKCPSKNNIDSLGISWQSPLFGALNEIVTKKWDRPFADENYYWREGFKCVQENPVILLVSFRYIYHLFFGNNLWPVGHTPMRLVDTPWTDFFDFILLPLCLWGLILLRKSKRPDQIVMSLMIISVFAIVWVFKSENRFRVPFDGLFLLWASFAADWIYQRVCAFDFSNISRIFSSPINAPTPVTNDTHTTGVEV
jgi:4-amino-4-deoxy-L-arabinose transferase-like glycosyltransferase